MAALPRNSPSQNRQFPGHAHAFIRGSQLAREGKVFMSFSGPAEDRLAIRKLIDAYADAVTRNDGAAWASTWAEDGEWSIPDGAGQTLTALGRDNILELWRQAMRQFSGVVFRAWPGAIAIDGPRATVRSFTSETYMAADGPTTMHGAYDDECVQEAGRWLFRRRAFTLLASSAGWHGRSSSTR